MFSFSYDEERRLLSLSQQGYWPMSVFRDYEQAYLAHHMQILRAHKDYRAIADCRDYPVQSTEVSAAFAQLFDRLIAENKGRYAVVTSSTLNKMQARRAMPQDNVGVFSERDEAIAWLFEEVSLPG
jgi:hypothetical protein